MAGEITFKETSCVVLPTRMRGCSLQQTSHSPEPGRCRLWPRPRSTPAGASPPPVDHRDLHPASRGTSAPHSAARCCYTPELQEKSEEKTEITIVFT